jgi:hypothetical protein
MSLFGTRWLERGLPVAACVLAVGAASSGCDDPKSYARLGVDVSIAGLDAAKRSKVQQIVVRSHVEGATGTESNYEVSVSPSQLDKNLSLHYDYVPYPQKGAFIVTARLLGEGGVELATRSERAVLAAGKTVRAKIDFVSEVTTSGACVPEGDVILVSDTEGGGRGFTLAWDVDHYLYVYSDLTTGKGDLVAVRLDALGNVLSPPLAVQTSPRRSDLPSLAKLPHGWALAWQEGDPKDTPATIELRHLDDLGTPIGNTRAISTSADEARPELALAFGKLAMTWIDHTGATESPDHLALVAFLDPGDFSYRVGQPTRLSPTADGATVDAFPSLAVIDQTLFVSWVSNDHDVYATTVGEHLDVAPPTELYTSSFVAQQLWTVPAGDRFLTVWEDLSGDLETGRERIRGAYADLGARLSFQGELTEPFSGSSNWPRGAYDEHGAVAVVDYQYRDFGSQVYLRRVAPDGTVLEAPTQVTDVPGHARYPDIRFAKSDAAGDHFGIGWISDHTGVPRAYFQAFVCR